MSTFHDTPALTPVARLFQIQVQLVKAGAALDAHSMATAIYIANVTGQDEPAQDYLRDAHDAATAVWKLYDAVRLLRHDLTRANATTITELR